MATILTKLLPKFPKLVQIDLSENMISHMVWSETAEIPSALKLRKLTLENPILGENNQHDTKQLERLLSAFPLLGDIGFNALGSELVSPHSQYLLDLNRCGYGLIHSHDEVPLSLWPLIMERAVNDELCDDYRGGDKRLPSILYLLLKGPALACQTL